MSAGPLAAQDVDLAELGTTHPGFRIDGIDMLDRAGVSVSDAGDVNGDGLDDVVVGGAYATVNTRLTTGETYVVFGKRNGAAVDLANLGTGGFRIDGIDNGDQAGRSVSKAGDVNGDGLNDLIVGAPFADFGPETEAGECYVVFGKADSALVDAGNLGTQGFLITGIDANDHAGYSVAGGGDVNGDGLDDLLIGARYADPGGNLSAGESYVVFGKASNLPVDLASLGGGGFRLDGIDAGDQSGRTVAIAGDVNGDGLDDLIIGARFGDPSGRTDAGESYVVFGKADTTPVSLGSLGAAGFRIEGAVAGDQSGYDVSGAGDVNGDGLDDLVVAAAFADPGGSLDAGTTYVVFGKADSLAVDLASLGAAGFRIDGIDQNDFSGRSVSGAGDVNGDGRDDVIIGASSGDPNGDMSAGESYVVFGKVDSATVSLANLGDGGFRIDGIDPGDYSGRAVSGAGDVNGDGLSDVIVGAFLADPGGISGAGESYVVFGNQDAADTQVVPPPMDLAAGDRLGGAVAIDGNLMVVGRPNVDATGVDSGQIVVYRVEGTKLIRDRTIDVPDTHFATNFGAALALEGNRLVIGAPGTDGAAQGKGPLAALQAAIFERLSDGSWVMKGALPPSDGNSGDEFGAAVAIDGETIAVGAPGDGATGALYVYQLDEGDNVVQNRKLAPPDGTPEGKFGSAVAAENGQIAVGSPAGAMGGPAAGLVRLYQQVGDNLMNLDDRGAMTGSQSGDGDAFGTSVALQGDTLIVGAPGEDVGGINRGAAYVFDPQNMTETGRMEPARPQDGAAFGAAVATNGSEFAVGAPGLDGSAGGAYRFSAANLRQSRLTRALPGQQAFGAAVMLAGDALAIGAPDTANSAGAAAVQRNPSRVFLNGFE